MGAQPHGAMMNSVAFVARIPTNLGLNPVEPGSSPTGSLRLASFEKISREFDSIDGRVSGLRARHLLAQMCWDLYIVGPEGKKAILETVNGKSKLDLVVRANAAGQAWRPFIGDACTIHRGPVRLAPP